MCGLKRSAPSLLLVIGFAIAAPAFAWKPSMHVYLAEQARLDALDGSVAIDTGADYRAGTHNPSPPTSYPVDAAIRQALADHPEQFRAGVIGPDAYPDLLTGQSIIHPHDTSPHRFSRGSDAWLEMLWDRATEAASRGDDRPLAFVLGILAHAAGDMYGHTFVNYYAGGPWQLGDNAVTHLIVEGYVGNRSPDPVFAMSIDGLEEFIYHHMIDATTTPRTPITFLYEVKGSDADPSLPWFFSRLRSSLFEFIEDWHAMSEGPGKWALAPAIPYANAWIDDIDRGLRRLPVTSTDVAEAVMFNPTGNADVAAAREILDDYFYLHMVSMLGAPDLVGDVLWLRDQMMDAVSSLIPDPFAARERLVMNWMVENATGRTLDEWESFVTDPETHMTTWPRLASRGLCGTAADSCKNEVDQAMQIDPSLPDDRFDWRDFPPAFNTVTMIKLAMLGDAGRQALMTDLGLPQSEALVYRNPWTPLKNAMIGFIRSLDGSRQWNAHSEQTLAHFDCYLYQQSFLNHRGDHEPGDPYGYSGGSAGPINNRCNQPKCCPDVASVEFTQMRTPTAGPYCGELILARVRLDEPADRHGAVVRLETTGALSAPRYAFIGPSSTGTVLTLGVQPVAQTQAMSLRASRETAATAQWSTRPPRALAPRIRAREFAGWRFLQEGDSVLGGTPVEVPAPLDCSNAVVGATVELELCPVSGAGNCQRASLAPQETWRFQLPYVGVDTEYRMRSSFGGEYRDRRLVLLSSRVNRITLNPDSAFNSVQASTTTAAVELFSPAVNDETLRIEYGGLPLTGPATVLVPAGQQTLSFPVSVPPSFVAARCAALPSWVQALSQLDFDQFGPGLTGRERYAEFLGLGAGFDRRCFEMIEIPPIDAPITAIGDRPILDLPDEDPDWGTFPPVEIPPLVERLLGEVAELKKTMAEQAEEIVRLTKELENRTPPP